MQRPEFEASLTAESPPEHFSTELAALWWIKSSNWQAAHDLIDPLPGSDAAWVHALLHRMEGDDLNANYWYRKAGRQRPNLTIGQEIEELLVFFLEKAG